MEVSLWCPRCVLRQPVELIPDSCYVTWPGNYSCNSFYCDWRCKVCGTKIQGGVSDGAGEEPCTSRRSLLRMLDHQFWLSQRKGELSPPQRFTWKIAYILAKLAIGNVREVEKARHS